MVKKGYYRHFKGKFYEVIDEARHSETLEDWVVYRAQYGKNELWIRSKTMFLETVTVNGREIPRFEYVGQTMEGER